MLTDSAPSTTLQVRVTAAFAVIAALSFFNVGHSQEKQLGPHTNKAASTAPSDEMEEAIAWLPPDTESLFVARGPFELPNSKAELTEFERLWRQFVTGEFAALEEGRFYERITGKRVSLAFMASRRYRMPKDVGMMRYEGCQVIRFEAASARAATDMMTEALKAPHRVIEIDGHKVAVFKEKRGRDDWTFYVVSPSTGVLLLATDHHFLSEMLRRMRMPGERRALPRNLLEWKYVDRKSTCWAIRHFDKEAAKNDPTSPLNPNQFETERDLQAIGLVFFCESTKTGRRLRVRHLTRTKDNLASVRDSWTLVMSLEDITVPEASYLEPGVIDIRHRPTNAEQTAFFYLVFILRFGPGACL